ncbi:MAG: hypothetical protein ACRCSV_03450 [Chlamydiales bacterium]
MKIFLLGFYIAFVSLSYGIEVAKPLPGQMVYFKQKAKKAIEPVKPPVLPVKIVDCNLKDKKITISDDENFLKYHIATIKKFHDSIDKTIQEVTSKSPTSGQIAKIMFAISNLINNIDIITQSNHLDKVMDVINESDYLDTVSDIYDLLCDAKNFLHIFSLSFIEESVKELPVTNEFDKKIESEWYKNGFANLTKSINMLEKFVELESCRENIMSFLPLVEKNHKQISDVISKMVTATSNTFLDEASEFVESIQGFNTLLKEIETNICLLSSKGITQAGEIVSLAKGLHTYFSDLSNKLKEILDEIKVEKEAKTNKSIVHYSCKSDRFIQDIIHDIFLCKYNKMFYKQMNNDVSELLTLIKNLEEIKK